MSRFFLLKNAFIRKNRRHQIALQVKNEVHVVVGTGMNISGAGLMRENKENTINGKYAKAASNVHKPGCAIKAALKLVLKDGLSCIPVQEFVLHLFSS